MHSQRETAIVIIIHDIELDKIFLFPLLATIVEDKQKVLDLVVDNGKINEIAMLLDRLVQIKLKLDKFL